MYMNKKKNQLRFHELYKKYTSIEMRGYVIFIKVETERPYSPMLHLQIENQLGFTQLQIACYSIIMTSLGLDH